MNIIMYGEMPPVVIVIIIVYGIIALAMALNDGSDNGSVC